MQRSLSTELLLPHADGTIQPYRTTAPARSNWPVKPFHSRVAYVAAHVVCDPLTTANPTTETQLEWDSTLAYRHYLWSLGFAVAEAMDTAQRGAGLDWPTSKELIRRSVAEARSVSGTIACGAGTDQLLPHPALTLGQIIAAYEEQCEFIEAHGGRIIVMASRALAACAKGPEDYVYVYNHILSQCSKPVILHWLGDMFDPWLAGYWGARDLDSAMQVCLQIIADHAAKIDGIKLSLLDHSREISMRRRLPNAIRMYTGDDFNYPELIHGDDYGHSHALLGILDAIAPAAAAALNALDNQDSQEYHAILEPTVPLARHIFTAPTYCYKTGIVFMAYLNGHQSHFRMVGGSESARSIGHLARLFVLADQAGLLHDIELATARMRHVLALAGVD